MAYFKTIANEIGSIDNGINLYLETLKTNPKLVGENTTLLFNGHEYPIGAFKDDTIDLFKEGMSTISDMYNYHHYNDMNGMYQHSSAYANKLLERFKDDPWKLDIIIPGFSNAFEEIENVPMFSDSEAMNLDDRISALKRKADEEIQSESKKPLIN